MKYLNIRVDGVDLDFQVVPEKFFFTYSIKGLEDFTKVGGALTERSIKIPATNKNDLVFDKWWDATGDNEEAANFKSIVISDGGEFVFQGQCILKKVELYGDHYGIRGKFYSIACYANNTDFIINLQGKLMSELSDLPQGLSYNDTDFAQGLIGLAGGFPFCTGFIKYGNWAVAGQVSIYEGTFLLYLTPLIRNVFNDLGYNVVSDFIDTEEFKRYCMPLIPFAEAPEGYARYLGNVRCSDTQGVIAAAGVVPLIYDTIEEDAIGFSPYNTTDGRYTAQFTGYYAFEVVVKIRSANTAVDFQVQGRINDTIPSQYNVFYDYQNANTFETFSAVVGVELQAGENFRFVLTQQLQNFDYEMVSLRCEVSEVQPQQGYPVVCEELLRDYKQSDFIAGLQHLFNLNIEANSAARTVVIEPADNYLTTNETAGVQQQLGFFNGSTTKQLDTLPTSYETSESSKLQKNVKYTFKVNDPTSEALENGAEIGYSDGVYSFSGDRYKNGTRTIENPFFYKTPLLFDEEVRGTQSLNTPFFPLLWSANYVEDKSPSFDYSNTVPRIFYARGNVDQNTRINIQYGGFLANNAVYNQLFMVDYGQYLTGAPALSFGNVTVGGVRLDGLLRRYYLPELKRLQVGKLLETWLFWRGLDMTNLTFRKKLYLEGARWVIQKIINYDATTSASTKTQLLLDAPVEEGDQNQIQNSDITPVLTTEGQPE